MHQHRRSERGFTVVEMAVSSLLLTAVSALVINVLVSTLQTSAEVHMVTNGSVATTQAADEISRELQAGVEVVLVAPRFIQFQEPVDPDGDGDFFNALGDLDLGANGTLDWSYYFIFEPSGTISEAVNGIDLDGDGAATSTVEIGDLVLVVKDENDVEQERRSVGGGNQVLQTQVGVTGPGLPDLFVEPAGVVPGDAVDVTISRLHDIHKSESDGPRVFQARRLVSFR